MPEKTHMISVRLTDAERRKLSQICAVSGLPVSAAIREMIGGITIRQRPPQQVDQAIGHGAVGHGLDAEAVGGSHARDVGEHGAADGDLT